MNTSNDAFQPGEVYLTHDDTLVMLDRRVPGTDRVWYVADFYQGHWAYDDNRIEVSALDRRVR